MSELIKDHGATKLLSLMLFIFVISLAAVLTMVPSNEFQRGMETEVKSLSTLISKSKWLNLTLEIERAYLNNYVNNGVKSVVEDSLLPKGNYKTKEIISAFKGDFILQRVVNNIHIMMYQMFYRLSILKYWVWVMAPFFVAIIYDGLMIRRIRMYEPKQISIKASRIWTRSIVYILVITFSYMLLPNFLGQQAPWFPIVMLFITGVALKNTIKNFMKVA